MVHVLRRTALCQCPFLDYPPCTGLGLGCGAAEPHAERRAQPVTPVS